MFQNTRKKSMLSSVLTMGELIYHTTVRSIRSTHGNAFLALFNNILTAVVFVLAFYFMFTILGMKSAKLRGDFMLYMMSGVFLYLTHIKAMGAVAGADNASSPMMQHGPMNTLISICSGALGALYIQVLSALVILFIYNAAFERIHIDDPISAFGMMLIAWFSGCAVGLIIMAAKPWSPMVVNIAQTIYSRANMVASGKLFVANTMPTYLLNMFDWNPLFHAIDQCRGFVFANYFPRNSDWHYALIVPCVIMVIGLLAEFYTRQYVSSSWFAKR